MRFQAGYRVTGLQVLERMSVSVTGYMGLHAPMQASKSLNEKERLTGSCLENFLGKAISIQMR